MSFPATLVTADPVVNSNTHFLLDGLGWDLLTLGGLATACACVGLALNQMHEQPLPLVYMPAQPLSHKAITYVESNNLVEFQTPPRQDAPKQGKSLRSINLEEFLELVQTKRGVVIDARPEIFHRLGHVPGALSLSREGFERDYATLRTFLEPLRGEAVAVYCSSVACEDSDMVADALTKLGYQHVLVFKGGWDEWTRAGLPEERR